MQYNQKKTSRPISRPWLESLARIGALFAAGVGSLCLTAQPVQAQQAQAGHDEVEAAAHEANTKSRVPKLKVVKSAKDEEIRSPGRAARSLEDGVPAGLISDEKAAAQFRKAFSLARLTLEGVELMGETEGDIRRRFAGCTEVASFSAAKVLSCERPKNFAGSGEYVLFSFMPVSRLLVGIQTYFADIEASQRTYAAWTKALADRYDAYEEQFVQAVDSVFWRISLGRDARGQGRWLRVQVNDEQELTATERFLQLDVGERNLGTLVFGETTSATVPAASRECEAAVYNNAYDKDFLGNCFGFPYDAHFQLEFSDKSGVLRQVVLSPLSQVTVEILDEILRTRYPDAAVCSRLETDATVNSARSLDVMNPSRRYRNVNGRPGTVYVGTCREPRIYEAEGRFIFDMTMLDAREMLANYEARKSVNANNAMRVGEREARRQRLGEFFANDGDDK